MHITAYCPECQSRYQLHADILGRKMRCPNPSCHTVFVVREATGGPPRDGANGPRAADPRREPAIPLAGTAPAPAPEFDWRAAPPPVQAAVPEPDPVVRVAGAEERSPGPKQSGLRSSAPATRTTRQRPPPPERDWDEPSPAGKRRWMMAVGVLLTLAIVSLAGYGVVHWVQVYAQDEDTRRAEAEADFQGGVYGRAAKKYHDLADKYGGGPRAAEYHFLADLGDLRDAAARTPPDPAEALRLAEAFVQKYDARDPQLKAHRDDLSAALLALATGIASAAEAPTATPELITQGRQALDLLRRFPPKDTTMVAALQARLDLAAQAIAKAAERRRAIDEVLRLLRQARPDINGARRMAMLRQVADDPLVMREIELAENVRVHATTYEVLNTPPRPAPPEDDPPGLLLETATGPKLPAAGSDVVLAVARGLLYALDGRDGRRLWAARVGLDAGDLPTRVPAREAAPELVVVASADPAALTARDVRTGAVVWHQPLDAPCLGRPVREPAGRLFVPTAGSDGHVYDLDARTGVIRGRFVTHERLAAGGAFDAANKRLYVPAHGRGVYVFNYNAAPKCDGLLPTGHAPGSLRGEPIVVSGEEGIEVPRYLVLGEADGLGAMTLRAFRLLEDPTVPLPSPPVRLPGWSWFPPYHDPETIALVTDAGAIGLFGIQQAGNGDPGLFPLVGESVSAAGRGSAPARPARAQLVHAEEYGFWVLADGVLRHWRLGLTRREGRKLVPAWGQGVPLGAPLHAAQVSADRHTLYLVTQTDSPPACRATAVDARTGDVVWQRPLGLAAQGDPVVVGGAVVVLDQSGAIYRFDGKQGEPTTAFQAGGTEIAPPVPDVVGTPLLLPAADGQSAWALHVRADGATYRLTLRHVAADGSVTSGSVAVPAPPAGAPAVAPGVVVLPLANGQLCRVTLDAQNPRRELGPDWRTPASRPDARGQVVHWKGDEYLIGDGGRQLKRLTWPAGGKYDVDAQSPLELPHRLTAPPVKLPAGVALVDASGTVTLLTGDRPTPSRSWPVGTVTAGPWVVGDLLAVVVDRRTLVCLNPAADQPVWKYVSDGHGIESPPRLIDGKLIVADLAGRLTVIDPATGKPVGGGYKITAEAAPSAITTYGAGRLFAPLTDGTVLVLPVAELSP